MTNLLNSYRRLQNFHLNENPKKRTVRTKKLIQMRKIYNYFLLPFSFYDLEFVYNVINLYYYIINLLESYVQRQIILLLSKLYFAT